MKTLPSDHPQALATLTSAIIRRVQRDGVCWVGPTQFRGRVMMRVSLSSWKTRAHDVELSAAAIAAAAELERAAAALG